MSRYINAKHFDERVRLAVGLEGENMTDDFKDGIQATLMLLRTEPTADVVEAVRGEWISLHNGYYKCSNCGMSWQLVGSPECNGMYYCMNCGAKMKMEVEE